MSVRLESNLELIVETLNENAPLACEAAQEIFVEAIQRQILYGYNIPHGKDGHTEIVDTGRLYDSITGDYNQQPDGSWVISVGASPEAGRMQDVSYAEYVHNGTAKLESRPFITDAVSDEETISEVETAVVDKLNPE